MSAGTQQEALPLIRGMPPTQLTSTFSVASGATWVKEKVSFQTCAHEWGAGAQAMGRERAIKQSREHREKGLTGALPPPGERETERSEAGESKGMRE